jgi:hypothetical protein
MRACYRCVPVGRRAEIQERHGHGCVKCLPRLHLLSAFFPGRPAPGPYSDRVRLQNFRESCNALHPLETGCRPPPRLQQPPTGRAPAAVLATHLLQPRRTVEREARLQPAASRPAGSATRLAVGRVPRWAARFSASFYDAPRRIPPTQREWFLLHLSF